MNENTTTAAGDTGAQSSAKGVGRQFLQKWKLLPIFGSVIGAVVGCVYFFQLPNQYKATAQVQIDSPSKEKAALELTEFNGNEVLKNAVGRIDLSQFKSTKGKSAEEVVCLLSEGKMLELKLVSKDVNSCIVNISATSTDQRLSGEVVKAVVDSYEIQAKQKYQSTITRLDMPTIGGFYGPYWTSFFWIGAVIGFVAFSIFAMSGIPELLGRHTKGRARLAT